MDCYENDIMPYLDEIEEMASAINLGDVAKILGVSAQNFRTLTYKYEELEKAVFKGRCKVKESTYAKKNKPVTPETLKKINQMDENSMKAFAKYFQAAESVSEYDALKYYLKRRVRTKAKKIADEKKEVEKVRALTLIAKPYYIVKSLHTGMCIADKRVRVKKFGSLSEIRYWFISHGVSESAYQIVKVRLVAGRQIRENVLLRHAKKCEYCDRYLKEGFLYCPKCGLNFRIGGVI